jgi:hypothetical protein
LDRQRISPLQFNGTDLVKVVNYKQMNTYIFTIGFLFCLFISIEIVRSWKFNAEIKRETFVVDSSLRKTVDTNVADLERLDIDLKHGEYILDKNRSVFEEKNKLDAEQDKIRDGFLDMLRVKVSDLQNSVVTVNGETEYKISSIMRRIEDLDKNKQSVSEFDSTVNEIHREIELIKSTNTTQSAAFDLAMNRTLDAEEVQQYKVIQDINKAYALKSDQVDIENKINNLVSMKGQVDESINNKTLEILDQIQSLKDIDKVVKEFEANNMKNANGDLVNKNFIEQLDRLHSDAIKQIENIDKQVDTLRLCETQNNLTERLQNAEKSISEAKSACESSKLVCEVAKGSDTIFMNPGGKIMLGDTGRYLTLREGDLEVCEKDDSCKTIVSS